jgi:hypothetical protein
MKKTKQESLDALLANYAAQFERLKQPIEDMRFFCKGTVLKRMMKCGKPRCACHQDPAKRHGPYYEWTFKSKGKTVNIRLRPEEASVYAAAIQQYRKLKSILMRMEALSRRALIALAQKTCREGSEADRS